jgi:hypothetical protein
MLYLAIDKHRKQLAAKPSQRTGRRAHEMPGQHKMAAAAYSSG